jgi:hypothetical protein
VEYRLHLQGRRVSQGKTQNEAGSKAEEHAKLKSKTVYQYVFFSLNNGVRHNWSYAFN